MTTQIRRPPLHYHGSKWRLAPWIIAHLPAHETYVEPYAGGLSVLLRKPPARFECANDLDGEVVNFFRVLRDHPDALIRALELTPWARAEYELTYESTDEPIERARRLFVRSHQSLYGGRHQGRRQGWRYQSASAGTRSVIGTWTTSEFLQPIAERLRLVQWECDEATAVIARWDRPDTLFYVDPPYVHSARGVSQAGHHGRVYQHEMTDEDHRRLAAAIHEVQGMVALSGYQTPLYDELYARWPRFERRHMANANQERVEYLWLSPRAAAARIQGELWARGG